MKQGQYRLLHQVASDAKGRPQILYIVIRRQGGTRMAGPYDDWRVAQRVADELERGMTPAPQPQPAAPADPPAAAAPLRAIR